MRLPQVTTDLLILNVDSALLVADFNSLISSFFDFLLAFGVVLFQDLFSGQGMVAGFVLAWDADSAPASEEVKLLLFLVELESLDDEELVVVFGEVGLGQGHAVEVFVLLDYFGFVFEGEVLVDGDEIYSFCHYLFGWGFGYSWLFVGFLVLLVSLLGLN
mgnify:CR=1 FL=1